MAQRSNSDQRGRLRLHYRFTHIAKGPPTRIDYRVVIARRGERVNWSQIRPSSDPGPESESRREREGNRSLSAPFAGFIGVHSQPPPAPGPRATDQPPSEEFRYFNWRIEIRGPTVLGQTARLILMSGRHYDDIASMTSPTNAPITRRSNRSISECDRGFCDTWYLVSSGIKWR